MAQQGRNFSIVLQEWNLPCRYLVHDRDTCFRALDGVVNTEQRRVLKTPPHAPLCNAFAERQVREIRETLNQLILLGPSHLHHTLGPIQLYHNSRRPHQGLGNVIPLAFDYPTKLALPLEIQCEEALDGLLNHYSIRQAA